MDLSKEEFDNRFRETLEDIIKAMAEHSEIDHRKFYGMTYFLENLAFFSPVIYAMIEDSKK